MAAKRMRVAAGVGVPLGALGMCATADAAVVTVTNVSDSGPGSLRDALIQVNGTPENDTVVFQSKLSGQITLTSGQIPITNPVEIRGPAAAGGTYPSRLTVAGDGSGRLFLVNLVTPGQPVVIAGLKLTGGNDPAALGGAVANVDGALTISRSTITSSTSAGAAVAGGGTSTTKISSSTLSGNQQTVVPSYGGGVLATGSARMIIYDSTISGNSATFGGGVADVTTAGGNIRISNSTITGNTATTRGGGVYQFNAPVQLLNTIVANNTAPLGPDVKNEFSAGFSLIENPADSTITDTAGNLLGQDPKLGPLAPFGGPTLTHSLLSGSAAIDAGNSNFPVYIYPLDQRGVTRQSVRAQFRGLAQPALAGSNGSDIGAYERGVCGGRLINVVGTAGKDKLKGTKKSDGIIGLGGADTLIGRSGADGLCGGAAKDTLKGGAGNDVLIGGKGKDRLDGGKGKDKEKQ